MASTHIRHEVEMMLSHVSEQLADAQRKLAEGALREKVEAAGELVLLRRQKQMIEDRLNDISRHASQSEDWLSLMREEFFNLSLRFRQFLTGSPH